MRKSTSIALGVVLTSVLVPTAAATTARLGIVASTSDSATDARVFAGGDLTRWQKRSIDARAVSFIRRADDSLRIAIDVRKVLIRSGFDQMFFLTLREGVGTDARRWESRLGFTSAGELPFATITDLNDPDTSINCDRIPVEVRPAVDRVIATLPRLCVPPDAATITLRSATGDFRTDASLSSKDAVRFEARHDLR